MRAKVQPYPAVPSPQLPGTGGSPAAPTPALAPMVTSRGEKAHHGGMAQRDEGDTVPSLQCPLPGPPQGSLLVAELSPCR